MFTRIATWIQPQNLRILTQIYHLKSQRNLLGTNLSNQPLSRVISRPRADSLPQYNLPSQGGQSRQSSTLQLPSIDERNSSSQYNLHSNKKIVPKSSRALRLQIQSSSNININSELSSVQQQQTSTGSININTQIFFNGNQSIPTKSNYNTKDDVSQDAYNLKQTLAVNQKPQNAAVFDVKQSKKKYEALLKNFERKNALPENLNMTKVLNNIENKPYLKLYQQKNSMHEGDREKASSLVCNLVPQKGQLSSMFGNNDQNANKDKTLNLKMDTLIHLGQEEQNKMIEIMRVRGDETEKIMRRNSLSKIDKIKESLKSSKKNQTSNKNYKIQAVKNPDIPTINVISPAREQSKRRMTLKEIMSLPPKIREAMRQQMLSVNTIDSQDLQTEEEFKSDSEIPKVEKNGQSRNVNNANINSLRIEDQDNNQHHQTAKLLNFVPSVDSIKNLKLDKSDLQTDYDMSTPNIRFTKTLAKNVQHTFDNSPINTCKTELRQDNPLRVAKRNKTLKNLITMFKHDKVKTEILRKNPDLEVIAHDHVHLFQEERKKSIPKKDQFRNLPLQEKLNLIEKFKLNPQEVLNKSERGVLKMEKQLFIPDQIKMTNLKKLLHKNVAKVNKWIKNSLRGTYQHEFDYFMQNDKTIVDKNSLQYQQLLDEQRAREILSQKLEASKGGYVDQNMRAIDLTHRKIINDILTKYQVKSYTVLPIFDEKRNQNDIKLQDVEKLQLEILKEHEEIELKLSMLKEKKFNKWRLLNQQFKNRQATLETYSPSPQMSPSLSPRNKSPRGKAFKSQLNATQSPDFQNSLESISPKNQNTQFTANGKVGQKFREFLMEKLDKQKNDELMTKLDKELQNQCQMLKDVDKDLEELQYFMVKNQNGQAKEVKDPLLPDDFYIRNGEKKHFSKNIALWKQQEIYDDLHGDYAAMVRKFKILQK
eukprot:403370744